MRFAPPESRARGAAFSARKSRQVRLPRETWRDAKGDGRLRCSRGSANRQSAKARGAQSRMLRIIGGAWRGRRFRFPPMRPRFGPRRIACARRFSTGSGRESSAARCLDLFAGSGALGLEALSRGAAQASFSSSRTLRPSREIQARLDGMGRCRAARSNRSDALAIPRARATAGAVRHRVSRPAFRVASLLPHAAHAARGRRLARAGSAHLPGSCPPAARYRPSCRAAWRPLKAKRAGEVGYHLYERGVRGDAAT